MLDNLKKGREEGAQIATGGKQLHSQGFENEHFIEPTILTNCADSTRVTREEIFGPGMSVLIFDDEQDAIERANSSEFGLGAGVIKTDLSRTHHVADAPISGNIWFNSVNILPLGLPFGRAKRPGFGRENSICTLNACSELKSVHITL